MRAPGALVTFTLALALAVPLTGCAGDAGPRVATGGGGTAAPAGASPAASADPEEMGIKFTQCLREHGLDVPDPQPGEGIRFKFGKDTDRTTVDKAMEACRRYAPGKVGTGGADPERQENQRKFAACMRENGVEKFPDLEGGQIKITPEIGEDPDFPAAERKCNEILSSGVSVGTR
ncbi:hypothetical protein Sru01_64410 [Sphaerisporangium rufum]|uniref:Secreted protein n=1 Tax=Sphaerisporangium rufum TaxID=1381558 RepID=A0A919R8C1_9ACTN|nr:hypothetical protein [Sphaerisporangium rufum]GII81459.1 hypothetical protein Sru01_64410 [Sphaerisporangium rufum]